MQATPEDLQREIVRLRDENDGLRRRLDPVGRDLTAVKNEVREVVRRWRTNEKLDDDTFAAMMVKSTIAGLRSLE